MKALILTLFVFGLNQFAMAEDSVTCDKDISVAWTDASTINVTGIPGYKTLSSLEIFQKNDRNYVRIENDKTVIANKRLMKVRVTIDNGTSIKSVYIFDWSQFEDGALVPVELYDKYPNGDLIFRNKFECNGAQS